MIRNITAQFRRGVDLTFAVGYEDGITKVERLSQEIVIADSGVLKNPAPGSS